MTLKYNEKDRSFVLITNDLGKAEKAGLTLSKTAHGPKGESVYYTADYDKKPDFNPYAVLDFYDQGDAKTKEKLALYKKDYDLSWEHDYAGHLPKPDNGMEYMGFQRAGIKFGVEKDNVLIGDDMGLGKEQNVNTQILTPTGWTTMGQLKIGDIVYGVDGFPCRVTGVFPQGVKPSYQVHFRDGTSTDCGLHHLWAVKSQNSIVRGGDWMVKSLEEIMKSGLVNKAGASKWCVPSVAPVEFEHRDFAIDPYVLGVLIGDGYLCGSTVTFSNPDFDWDIRERVAESLPDGGYLTEHRGPTCPQFNIVFDTHKKNVFKDELRYMGLDVKSCDKFIPEGYKWGSVQQRLDLLRGLMDTDGSNNKNRVTFHTISQTLAYDVAYLTRSLGGEAIIRGYDRSHEGKPYEYQVNVRLGMCPFYSVRKSEGWSVARKGFGHRWITEVTRNPDCEQVCIAVNHPRHLYVVNDFIVTHNTVQAIGICNENKGKRNLVIVPASIRLNWARMIQKWSTIEDVSTHAVLKASQGIGDCGSTDPRTMLKHYTIISYDLTRNDGIHGAILDNTWDNMILDEAHFLKSIGANRTQAIFGGGNKYGEDFIAKKVGKIIALTGTPLLNRPRECYTLARALNWESIDYESYDSFCYRYNPSGAVASKKKDGEKFTYIREEKGRLSELQARLRCNFMIRRLKEDVLTQLPDKRYDFSYIEPNGRISEVLAREKLIKFDISDLKNPFSELMGMISTIRREMGEAKAPLVVEHMKYLLDIEEIPKVVLFAHHNSVMDELSARLSGYGLVTIRGGMSTIAKQKAVDKFVNDPKARLFMGQMDAAGFGVDGLQSVCSRAVFAEPAWSPGVNEQCIDRLNRMGQHENVIAEFLVVAGSLDERVLAAVLDKSQTIYEALDRRFAV